MADDDSFKVPHDVVIPEEELEDSEGLGGHASDPSTDDDTEAMVEEVIGNPPKPGKPFSIADEVDKDSSRNIPPEK